MAIGKAFPCLIALFTCAALFLPASSRDSVALPVLPAADATGAAAQAGSGDPVLLAAGDIANCSMIAGAQATAKIIEGIPGTVVAIGDLALDNGTAEEFANC